MRRHGKSRALEANQSSNATTSFEFLAFSFEFNGKEIIAAKERKIHERLNWKNPDNLSLDDSTNWVAKSAIVWKVIL